jgi:hypothetical protein
MSKKYLVFETDCDVKIYNHELNYHYFGQSTAITRVTIKNYLGYLKPSTTNDSSDTQF